MIDFFVQNLARATGPAPGISVGCGIMFISLAVSLDKAIELGEELILYSDKRAEYIGVAGAGKILLQALGRQQGAIPSEVLFANVLRGSDSSSAERAMLEEALRVLVGEGLCNEQP